jgi:hypothetical protein
MGAYLTVPCCFVLGMPLESKGKAKLPSRVLATTHRCMIMMHNYARSCGIRSLPEIFWRIYLLMASLSRHNIICIVAICFIDELHQVQYQHLVHGVRLA